MRKARQPTHMFLNSYFSGNKHYSVTIQVTISISFSFKVSSTCKSTSPITKQPFSHNCADQYFTTYPIQQIKLNYVELNQVSNFTWLQLLFFAWFDSDKAATLWWPVNAMFRFLVPQQFSWKLFQLLKAIVDSVVQRGSLTFTAMNREIKTHTLVLSFLIW